LPPQALSANAATNTAKIPYLRIVFTVVIGAVE
jgi:hypothetical protein